MTTIFTVPLISLYFKVAQTMMDGLSATASGVAVATIALQLAESVRKLHEFWNSVKDAPESIRAIAVDLELLSNVLADIASEAQHVDLDTSVGNILSTCTTKSQALHVILDNMGAGFSAANVISRKWARVKAVLKKEKVKNFQEILESLKTTLILAQQKCNRYEVFLLCNVLYPLSDLMSNHLGIDTRIPK